MNRSDAAEDETSGDVPILAGYTQVDADLDHAGEVVVGLWKGNIGWPGQLPQMYDAIYRYCPVGQPLLKLLRHEASATFVGTTAIGPRRILWRGREIRGGVASHISFLAPHRKVKPALFLMRSMWNAGRGHFDMLYGLPNNRGASVCRLAGYKVGAELIRHAKVLRYQGYVQRYLPRPFAAVGGGLINGASRAWDRLRGMFETSRPHAEWCDRVDPRMAQLWERSPKGGGWVTVRDNVMLQWRFDELPSLRRRYLLLSAAAGEELSAWFVCDTHVSDPHMLTVNDFWSTQGVLGMDPLAVRALCRAAYREGFHAIELHFTGADAIHASWASEGFVERSRQPMFVRWYNQDVAGELRGNLHITDIEFES